MPNSNKNNGFTLIEMLIGVSIIGILGALLITIINPDRARRVAQNGVQISRLSDAGNGIVVFRTAEGFYPDPGALGNPLTGSHAAAVGTYLTWWPDDGDYTYSTVTSGSNTFMCVSVTQAHAEKPNCPFFKFISPHNSAVTGGLARCANKVVRCTTVCTDQTNSILLSNCEDLEGKACGSGTPCD